MASLEFISHSPRECVVADGKVHWQKGPGQFIPRLPQLVWENNTTWGEANLWALDQAEGKDIKTVQAALNHLLAYANWLESEGIGWWHFPALEKDRCLKKFRGALIRSRTAGEIAPSTATARMSAVVRFYRWLKLTGLLSTSWPMWNERQVGIRLTDNFGLEHTLRVASTDLAIKNTKVAGAIKLEDGVMPLNSKGRREVLELSAAHASVELDLMIRLGFGSGLRINSILDLKPRTLERATEDIVPGWFRMAVGPGANPPIATKFDNSGMVPIPKVLLDELLDYASSIRRLKRAALALPEHRNLLFLSRFGRPYSGSESRAVNVEISRLRQVGLAAGLEVMRAFHFHRTRATFATMLMRACLSCMSVADAVQFVREACLHRDESTTFKYVKFIESTKAMAEAADAFTAEFMGLAEGSRDA